MAATTLTPEKTAIIIASFGTTNPGAVSAIVNIVNATRMAYPMAEVRLTFTSNIIRSIWKKRRADAQKWLDQDVAEEVLYVKNILQTLGDLQEDGYRNVIVQPTHMFYMEESSDLEKYINGILSIKTTKEKWRPFNQIVLGRPALGKPESKHDVNDDVAKAVTTVSADIALAKKEDAILLYMGHGNKDWPCSIYGIAQEAMNTAYPDIQTIFGVVEGYPSIEDIIPALLATGKKKIVLKPFMIVAGDHAHNDMAGTDDDSWKSILSAKGFTVFPILKGMGSNNAFARIFVDHIKEAAEENDINL